MTAISSSAMEIPGASYSAGTVHKLKERVLRVLEENKVILDEFLDEKLAIEKQVVNLSAERDLELARLQMEEEKTRKVKELERNLSQSLISIDQQAQEQRFQLETQTVSSLAECMRVKFEKDNFALISEPSFFSVDPLPVHPPLK
jgi:hypothetical protein